jgi:hypothetical protein
MADAAKRLSGPTALTTTAATQYTVPASTTAILRSVHVCNESATTSWFTVSIGTDGAGKRLWFQQDVDPKSSFDWSGFIVLATGEVIQALTQTATSNTLTISGVEVQ